jgi:glycosyltransferase involved in cell wall biosynthesis
VTPGFPPFNGGGERYARSLALALAGCGHRVTIVTSSARGEQAFWEGTASSAIERESDGPLELIRCPIAPFPGGRRGLHLWRALMIMASALPGDQTSLLLRMARRIPPLVGLEEALSQLRDLPQIVNGFNLSWEYPLAAAWQYAREQGIPYVLTPFGHFGESERVKMARNATMDHQRRILEDANAVLTLTTVEEEGFQRWQIAPRHVTVVGGGVDPPPPAVDATQLLQRYQLQTPYALFVGRATIDKGAIHAVKAIARLQPFHPELSLVMVGRSTPELKQALRQLPADARKAIRTLGAVEEAKKHALFQEAAMLLLPSRAESLGIVMLEAWWHATPVIAAQAGGILGVVDNGRNGLLVPFGDVAALADAIEQLLVDEELRRSLGRQGQEKVRQQYSWDKVAQRTLDLYQTVLQQKG